MNTPAPRYQAVLFDCDGTVANTLEAIIESYQHTFKTVLGQQISAETAKSFMGMPLKETFEEAHPGKWQEMMTAYRSYNKELLKPKTKPYPGVDELLDALNQAKIKTGIVTSKRKDPAGLTLEYAGVGGKIQILCALEDTEIHKPNPEPLLKAAGLLGVEPNQCAYVGDAIFDIQAAQAAGMDALAVTWGAGVLTELQAQKPTQIFTTVTELKKYLLA